MNRPSANVGLKEEVAGGCFNRWFIHKPDPEGARYLEIELWDDPLVAQISVGKQPFAYFNKELVQQIDASGIGLSTVFSPKMQSRQLEPPLSMGPPLHLEAAAWESRGRTAWRDPPFPDCGLVHTGAGVHLGILPRAEAKGALAGVVCRCQGLGSQH